jgi:uncharacterized membrane protein YphA (DoxX/SURF4 family)
MNLLFLILQGFLSIAFLGSGLLKVVPGDTPPKQNYAKMRLPMWWLAPIGYTEVITGLCVLIGFFLPVFLVVGAVLAFCTMAGAVLAHVVRDETYEGYPALVLLLVSGVVLWANWASVMRLFS